MTSSRAHGRVSQIQIPESTAQTNTNTRWSKSSSPQFLPDSPRLSAAGSAGADPYAQIKSNICRQSDATTTTTTTTTVSAWSGLCVRECLYVLGCRFTCLLVPLHSQATHGHTDDHRRVIQLGLGAALGPRGGGEGCTGGYVLLFVTPTVSSHSHGEVPPAVGRLVTSSVLH